MKEFVGRSVQLNIIWNLIYDGDINNLTLDEVQGFDYPVKHEYNTVILNDNVESLWDTTQIAALQRNGGHSYFNFRTNRASDEGRTKLLYAPELSDFLLITPNDVDNDANLVNPECIEKLAKWFEPRDEDIDQGDPDSDMPDIF